MAPEPPLISDGTLFCTGLSDVGIYGRMDGSRQLPLGSLVRHLAGLGTEKIVWQSYVQEGYKGLAKFTSS